MIGKIYFYAALFGALLAAPAMGQGRGSQGQGQQGQGQQGQGQQGQGQQGQTRPGGGGFNALPIILRIIQDNPPASLVVLDAGETSWAAQASSLLQQDPLVALNLNIIPLDAASGAGLELIQREGWAMGAPRWCLIGADGRALFNSGQEPNPQSIMDAFRGAGFQSRLDILRRFLSAYPEHAEARLAFLGELMAVAEARTRAALGMSAVRSAFLQNTITISFGQNAQPDPPQQLESGLDSDIWAEYARESDSAFQMGLWKQDSSQLFGGGFSPIFGGFARGGGGRGGSTSLVSRLGQHSPMMTRQYRRWLPDVEYALGKRPSSYTLWNFWLSVQRSAGKSDLKALQAGLVPAPDGSLQDIPPSFVRTQWIQDCIARGDWPLAEDVARDSWENLLAQAGSTTAGQGRPGRARPGSPFDEVVAMFGENQLLSARTWSSDAEPYIEVLLRLQKTGAADGIVQQWFSSGGWTGAAQRAMNLANRLGFAELGTKWGALAPQGQQRQQTPQGPARR
jgi:hypothetical protein